MENQSTAPIPAPAAEQSGAQLADAHTPGAGDGLTAEAGLRTSLEWLNVTRERAVEERTGVCLSVRRRESCAWLGSWRVLLLPICVQSS